MSRRHKAKLTGRDPRADPKLIGAPTSAEEISCLSVGLEALDVAENINIDFP